MPRSKQDPFFFTEMYDYVEKCAHGVPLDFECEECRIIRRVSLTEDIHDQWWDSTDYGNAFDAEVEEDSSRYPEW